MGRWPLLFIATLLLGVLACESGPSDEVNVRFMPTDRARIDTLVSNQVQLLRKEMDSICRLRHDELVDRLTDSIVRERLREEMRLRARIQSQLSQ